MKKLLLIILLSQVFLAHGQTYVTILGTVHFPTDNINSHDLYDILSKIKPDVILMELDSSMNEKGEFLVNSNEVEPTAVKRLLKDYPVIVRPFDYKNRNKFYTENKIFKKEDEFYHTLDSVYNKGLLDSLSLITYQNLIEINNVLNNIFTGDLKEINGTTAQSIAGLRQDISYSRMLNKICYRNKYMQPYARFWKQDGDFWIFRGNTMVDNILNYTDEFKGKKIVVLTGAMHKYFLIKSLTSKAKEKNVMLKDYWEYN